jgi:hypothetical protein
LIKWQTLLKPVDDCPFRGVEPGTNFVNRTQECSCARYSGLDGLPEPILGSAKVGRRPLDRFNKFDSGCVDACRNLALQALNQPCQGRDIFASRTRPDLIE